MRRQTTKGIESAYTHGKISFCNVVVVAIVLAVATLITLLLSSEAQ